MHDVVRQMALWVACNFGEEKEKENFVVKTGAGLQQMPEVGDWNAVRRMSLQNNVIKNISVSPDCPNLTTLFLQMNKLENISCEFFQLMPMLVVLELSWNKYLEKLPEEVLMLVSLRYLGLSGTKLKELPMGLRELIRLRHLDLNYMENLRSISVISSLLNLETLGLFNSAPLSLQSIEDLVLLEKLKVLNVTITQVSILDCLLSIPRLAACTCGLSLEGIKVNPISFAKVSASLRVLTIARCYISYIKEELRYFSRSPSHMCFQNLHTVKLSQVGGVQDLTWLLLAQSLTFLFVAGSLQLKEIISREKAATVMNEGSNIIPFPRLRTLYINGLVELKSIYWEPLVFSNLKAIIVTNCPKLKKLPLNKDSAKGNHIRLTTDKKEWLEGVEWEDEATKDQFLLLSKVMGPKNLAAQSF